MQGAVLSAGAVDGQDVVPRVQGPAPGQVDMEAGPAPAGPYVPHTLETVPSGPHLSTTLAGLMRSIVMTGLFQWQLVVSEMPRAHPGIFMISTTSGPDAPATTSAHGDRGVDREVGRTSLPAPLGTAMMDGFPVLQSQGRGAVPGLRTLVWGPQTRGLCGPHGFAGLC